jgi:pilus assembly protein TadC
MAALGVFIMLALAAGCLLHADAARRWSGGTAGSAAARFRAGEDDRRAGAAFPAFGWRGPTEAAGGIADVPLLLELLGAALDAGLAIPWALKLVAGVSTARIRTELSQVVAGLQIGASWEHSWQGMSDRGAVGQLHSALSFAALTGAPAAPLLYAAAAQRRRQAQRDAEKKAAALGVRLVVPLGLCSLPAFICLGIVPVVVAMIPSL